MQITMAMLTHGVERRADGLHVGPIIDAFHAYVLPAEGVPFILFIRGWGPEDKTELGIKFRDPDGRNARYGFDGNPAEAWRQSRAGSGTKEIIQFEAAWEIKLWIERQGVYYLDLAVAGSGQPTLSIPLEVDLAAAARA